MNAGGLPRPRMFGREDRLLADIGATSVTGIRRDAVPEAAKGQRFVGHPIFATLPLGVEEGLRLGSDFVRTGLLFDKPDFSAEHFTDAFGVSWLTADSQLAPFRHPLQAADIEEVGRYPRPVWPSQIQQAAGAEGLFSIADAPCPGMLDLCFALRNAWNFIDDIATGGALASALLDWALETILSAYQHLLTQLPWQPDIILYGDDLGFRSGMFMSVAEFRLHLKPRMRLLFAGLRKWAPGAAIAFHSCGAIEPLLADLADLGIDILNLDGKAKDMSPEQLRVRLPSDIVLYGCTDICALGNALARNDLASVALLTTDVAASLPAITAPLDVIAAPPDLTAACRAIAYLRALGRRIVQGQAG